MAENSPPAQEGETEPFPSFTSLPHGHPATSFSSNNSHADLDRQAMPPPGHPSSAAPGPSVPTLIFEPRVLYPFRLCDAFTDEREAWLTNSAAHFHALVKQTGIVLKSLTSARNLEEEMLIIDIAIRINEEGQRLSAHIIDGLVGLCGPEDVELGLVRADWHTFMNNEFHADAERAERCGRDLLKRKAIVQLQMECVNKMGHLAEDQAALVSQGILRTVGATLTPLVVAPPEPVYNLMFEPQGVAQPHSSGVAPPQQDPMQAPHGLRLPGRHQPDHSFSSPQRTRAADISLDRRQSQSAVAHQFDIVSSPASTLPESAKRTDSSGGYSKGSKQELQPAIRTRKYESATGRRPTDGSQGSFDPYPGSRSLQPNSPAGPRPAFVTGHDEWRDGQYKAEVSSHGGSFNQSPERTVESSSSQDAHGKPDKGKGREPSPSRHRGRSPAKDLGRQNSVSPSNNQPRPETTTGVDEAGPHTGASADYFHPISTAPSGSIVEKAEMLAALGQQHMSKASEKFRSDNFNVAVFKLDDAAATGARTRSLASLHSSKSDTHTVPPHFGYRGYGSASDSKQGAQLTDTLEAPREQQLSSIKPMLKHTGKVGNRSESCGASSKLRPGQTSLPTKVSSKEPSEKPARSYDNLGNKPSERRESNEWQVAQSKHHKKESAAKAQNKNQPAKEKSSKPEDNSRNKAKKGASNGPGQERESSVRGEKKIEEKRGTESAQSPAQVDIQSLDVAECGKAKSQGKKAKGKEVAEPYIAPEPRLNDSSEAAFPFLPSPATPSTNNDATQLNMSWMAALKSADHGIEADKLRLAGKTDLPMGPDAICVQKASVLADTVSVPLVPPFKAFTHASAAIGSWKTKRGLTAKQKTPGPKAKAPSGELRATATPFTPPATGSSLLSLNSQGTFAVPVAHTNSPTPTYAQRAAAASTREGEAAVMTAKHLTKKERKASAKSAPGNPSPKNTGSDFGGHLKSTDSYPDLASKIQQKGGSKLSISDYAEGMCVPTLIAGPVSSQSMGSVKSLPSTPMVPTYAQRAASASLLVLAPPKKPKDEAPFERSGNAATPKSAKQPRPVPSTPAPTLPESTPKTIRHSTSRPSLHGGARSFSYASKAASSAPPEMTSLVDDAYREEHKPDSVKGQKTAGSRSAPASAPVAGKEDSKDKNKKPGSTLASGPPPTLDASARKVESSDAARASIASASTATTSASSATLVSSETISSESASSASVRTNSDVGSPSPFYRLKAIHKPTKPLSEEGYKAPVETWAQKAQKASRRYVMPPSMDLQQNIELKRESRLTTPVGARGTTGAGRDEHWRGGKSGQASEVRGGYDADQGNKEDWGKQPFEDDLCVTKATPPSNDESSSAAADGEPDSGKQSQGVGEKLQCEDGNLQRADDATEGSPTLRKTPTQIASQTESRTESQRGSANASTNSSGRGRTEPGAGKATQGEEEKAAREPDEGSPQKSGYTVDERARSAGDGDCKDPVGEHDETKQTVPAKEEGVEDSGPGGSGGLESTEASSLECSDDSQLTVKSKQRSRASRRHNRLVAERHAKSKAEEAASEKPKAKEAKEDKSNTQDTPPKISWADDDEDEWAGFDPLPRTTLEVRKEGEERKGG